MELDFVTVKKNVDLVSLVEQAGGQLRKTGAEWRGPCPLHGGDNKSGFAVYPDGAELKWKCFTGTCGQGDAIDFVQAWQGLDKVGAYRYLGGEERPDPAKVEAARLERERVQAAEHAVRMQKLEQATRDFATHEIWELFCKRMSDEHRAWWRNQGIPNEWQEFWRLGYTPERIFDFEGKQYKSPAYTIPKFHYERQPKNCDYRLVNYPEGAGKYRPEYGLPAAYFLSRPDMMQPPDELVIVEGSKKAMVTTIFGGMNIDQVHIIGIPSKNSWAGADGLAKNCGRVWIALDPDATDWAYKLAQVIGPNARVMELPFKPDDGFLLYGMTPKLWQEAQKYARMPKGTMQK